MLPGNHAIDFLRQAPVGIAILRGPHFIADMANDTYLQIIAQTEDSFVGKPLAESLPAVMPAVGPLLDSVLQTGEPYHGIEYEVQINRFGKVERAFFNFTYQPVKDAEGKVNSIMVVAIEVTQQVEARSMLQESERAFRNMVMQSPIPMTIFKGRDFVIDIANYAMLKTLWRKDREEVEGQRLLDVFPELKGQKYPELLYKVFDTGIAHSEKESIAYVDSKDGRKTFYLDYEYAPLYDVDKKVYALLVTVTDVTSKVEARRIIEEAEERSRLAIEAAMSGTFDISLPAYNGICSPRFFEIFGLPANASFGDAMENIHEDDWALWREAKENVVSNGGLNIELRLRWDEGSVHWVQLQGKVFFNAQDEPFRLLGTAIDTTAQREAEVALRASEKRFRLLADSMPQIIWTCDADGKLSYFNETLYRYAGITREDIKVHGGLSVVHPDDREENMRKWLHSVSTGEAFLFEQRFRRHDGTYRWQLSRALPQYDEHGNVEMWVGSSTDIHDQKTFVDQLEQKVKERTKELELANKELEVKNQELSSFAYISSHDLQEPLRKIQTFTSRIAETEAALSAVNRQYFSRIQAAAGRMQTLIKDLLAYSRTNSAEHEYTLTDLNQMLREIRHELLENPANKHATIHVAHLPVVRVITFQFHQLFTNILSNSLKFAKENVPAIIHVQYETVNPGMENEHGLKPGTTYHHITISDNGIGFLPEYSQRIFEVFQRLHGRHEYEGTGIGLAICKKIVENHHGIIYGSSIQNKGADFHILIPVSEISHPL